MRLALHACCAPCLLEPYDALAPEAERVVVVYANPNIHPEAEYERRRDTLREYAREEGIEFVELPYEPDEWHELVGVHGDDRERRCRACYRLRLSKVAAWADENGFDALATTLTVSPYQDAVALAEKAERAARDAGLVYAGRDFRDRYQEATRRSRELGMYRQNYCGCVFSEAEAERDREAARAARAAAKERRRLARLLGTDADTGAGGQD